MSIKKNPKTLRTVSIADPALDTQAMGAALGDFLSERDASACVFLEGEKPTWFTIGRIDAAGFMSYVAAAPDEMTRRMRAFELGVAKIEDLPNDDGAPVTMTPERTETIGAGAIRTRWSDAQLAEIPPAYLIEIGELALTMSLLGKAGVGRWPLPPSLERVLVARQRHTQPAAETGETSEG